MKYTHKHSYLRFTRRHKLFTAVLFVLCFFCALAFATPLHPAALHYTGTHQLQLDQYLDGTGTTITSVCRSLTYKDGDPQMDYNWNASHKCFADTDLTLSDGLGGISPHATSIGGILVGSDPNAYDPDNGDFYYFGAAPGATVKISEFWRFISNFTAADNPVETDVITMSVGVAFESWWTRRLELLASEQGTVIVAGIGNGKDVCEPQYYPAAGPNCIGVGVIDPADANSLDSSLIDFTLPSQAHSSIGPTSDGRCGVDIVAPGNCLVPDANSPTGYSRSGNWTSFAAPVVAGTISLLTQHVKSDEVLAPAIADDGGNCVMKAILLNSAKKLDNWHKGTPDPNDDTEYSLDFLQGAGALDAQTAFAQLNAGIQSPGKVSATGWDSGKIERLQDAVKYYRFKLDETADYDIAVTLTWNRHYKSEYPYVADLKKDRDLRVELWASDNGKPGTEKMIDYCDTVNDNIEHIYCKAEPGLNTYEILVASNDDPLMKKGEEITSSPETYALAWRVKKEK